MKKSFLLLSAFFITGKLHAQKDFEGSIKYRATSPESVWGKREKEDLEFNIYFGYRSIFINNNMRGEENDLIVMLDSAKIILLNRDDKTYEEKVLVVRRPQLAATREIIAGQSASPIQNNSASLPGMGMLNATFWYADSLFFHVPDKFSINEELLMVSNNRILLKARISMDMGRNHMEEAEDQTGKEEDFVMVVATEISPRSLPLSMFRIPGGYRRADKYIPSLDTLSITPDTTIVTDTTTVSEKVTITTPVDPIKTKNKQAAPLKSNVTTSPVKKED